MEKCPCIYMLASKKNGTLYIGVTSNLNQRIYQHKQNQSIGFTQKYGVHSLVYYEVFTNMYDAISREKQLKKWNRAWKVNLIEKENPSWKDLSEHLI